MRSWVRQCRPDDRQELIDDFFRAPVDRNDDRVFVGGRLFESLELTLQKTGRHEMPVPARQPGGDQLPIALEIDQQHVRPVAYDDVPVPVLERRAGDYAVAAGGTAPIDPAGDRLQP